ncbi:uncharacterized protein LOC115395681 [Salarias fasciatus]|uniref:uncharacterized protein LOC115395681 n=1 Tax=Salarias fasciatus TaxID=181472 RepID=UPI001176D8C7|nr:uncharacterized protein LOC115395681 [Salarias fasciatus]
MGRRAADLTTPVPVLGVPALVGVRAWKTTGADRAGGALLQAWGLQCSVGVQTSPGISRLPTQLTGTLSDSITQTSSSYINKETEYKELLLLTKTDKEKKAILKLKSGESKTKKEVTFKALGGEASKDVTCCQRNSGGTYCFAKAIKTNPHVVGNVTNSRSKAAARYVNGSVVDSEAIGGISVDSDEAEPTKNASCRGREQTRLQGHYADEAGKTLPLSAARPFGVSQKVCNNCGGRQSASTGAATFRDTYLEEKPLKSGLSSLLTNTHFHMPPIDKNFKKSQQISESTDKRMQLTDTSQILYVNEELRYRKTPHPACPVHSRGNPDGWPHSSSSSSSSASIQPSAFLQAKTITVTQATIEPRYEPSVKCSPKTSQERKIPRPTSLTLGPQMATATKTNNPHSHTYPKLPKTAQHSSTRPNLPRDVCVSVHAAPESTLSPPSHLYTTATGPGSTSSTSTHRGIINSVVTTTESLAAETKAKYETLHSHCVKVS